MQTKYPTNHKVDVSALLLNHFHLLHLKAIVAQLFCLEQYLANARMFWRYTTNKKIRHL